MTPPHITDSLEIGFVRKAHGLRGQIAVQLHDPGSSALEEVAHLLLGEPPRSYDLKAAQELGGGMYLVQLAGVSDRDAAEALRGAVVRALRQELEPLAEDELYLADLVGAAVHLPGGERVGTIRAVPNLGGRDLLQVELDAGGEALVPWVPEIITAVDLESQPQRVVIDPPEGLLELGR